MAAKLHSSCHWAAPAADPALEVWLFRAQPGGTALQCKCSKWVLGFFAFEASSELVSLVAIGGQEEERERWR